MELRQKDRHHAVIVEKAEGNRSQQQHGKNDQQFAKHIENAADSHVIVSLRKVQPKKAVGLFIGEKKFSTLLDLPGEKDHQVVIRSASLVSPEGIKTSLP